MINNSHNSIKSILNNIPYVKEFSGFAFGYFIAAFFSFLIISLVNKLLEPAEMGRYSYYKSIFELLYAILSINIYSAYLRFNLNGENRKLTRLVLTIVLLATVLLAIIIGFTLKCIFCSLFSLIILYNERMYYFRSLLEIRKLNWIRISPALITLSIIYFTSFVYNNQLDATTIFLAYGIGYSFVLFFFKKNNYKIDDSQVSVKNILAYSIPSVGLIIVDWVLNLSSQILIKEYFSFAELSYYAVAQRLLLVVKLFSGLFLMFYPMLYFKEIKKKNHSFISKARGLMLITIFLIIILFFVFSKYIYNLMGAGSYLSHQSIFKVLLFSEFFKVASSIFGLFLSYKIQTYKNLIILSIGSIINVILLLLFLHQYGLMVAAYSNLIANIIICILYYFHSYRLEIKYLKHE
mgnify:FL=1|jgi:O-antigen/teichoic acid export membrane protein